MQALRGSLQPWRQARNYQAIRLLQSRDEDVQKNENERIILKMLRSKLNRPSNLQ